ncbi:MAG: hypothetical protein IJF23_02935, partial [Clostridia bacterium]|nr:hypothetical protein [Clostridia bacterium]
MSKKSEFLYEAMGNIDDDIIAAASSAKKIKKKKPNPVKWLSIAACFILVAGIGVGVWMSGIGRPAVVPSNGEESSEKYNRTEMVAYPAACSLPYSTTTFAELGLSMIEFVVLSEPQKVDYEVFESYEVWKYLSNSYNYTEEEYAAAVEKATKTYSAYKLPVRIENVFTEGKYKNVSSYDEIWLVGYAFRYPEGFAEGGRFVAYADIRSRSDGPVELNVNDCVFYVDQNRELFSYFKDPSLMQYNGKTVEEMAKLTLAAEKEVKEH